VGYVFGGFALGLDGTFILALVIPVIAALTAVTSRVTVRRYLSEAS
jgi:cell division transport system permease protein